MESGDPHPVTEPNGTFGDLILMFIPSGNEKTPYLYDCYAHDRIALLDEYVSFVSNYSSYSCSYE
jgi:hypothetical protein